MTVVSKAIALLYGRPSMVRGCEESLDAELTPLAGV